MNTPTRTPPLLLLSALLSVWLLAASATAQMRVATYNCARLLGDGPAFQDVLEAIMDDDTPGFASPPWVIVFQEVPSSIVNNLQARMNTAGLPYGASYTLATYTSSVMEDGSAGAIALFYRTGKLVEVPGTHVDIPTGGNRNTDRWKLKLVGYDAPEVSFYVYGSHLKAEDDAPSAAERNAGVQAIRANANTLPAGSKIIYLGDLNFYSNSEAAYQSFIAAGNGRAIDAFGNGSWAGSGNAIKHTQSPCTSCLPSLVSGGLDDRFDFILFTDALNNSTGLGRISGTYRSLGNDGQHYDIAINVGNNFYFPGNIPRSNLLADALHDASDHIPVILDFRIPAYALASMPAVVGPVIVDASVQVPVTIVNAASGVAAGVDPLNYTALGTSHLTGGGMGSVGPLPDTDIINLTLDTSSPGNLALGALVVSTGQDVQNANIILNGAATVLDHAAPSFSSRAIVSEAIVSMRFEADTGVQQLNVPVHNVGFDALQAALDLDAISSATPPFAFQGGLANNIGSTPATLTFSFDTTGLTPGTYADSFIIDVSDQNLPGESFSQLALDIEIVINRTKTLPCLGDMVSSATLQPPADGFVDGADLAYLLGEWGDEPGSIADFVTSETLLPPPDGIVDGADLAVLLGNWGPCD